MQEVHEGRIIKGIAGFYYIHVYGRGVYECHAKGIFRKDAKKPLVGDFVRMQCIDEEQFKGNITHILPRRSELLRPAVANVDRAVIIFSVVKPEPNFNLLDRFLIMLQEQNLDCTICFNKQDIADESQLNSLAKSYEACGNKVLFTSAVCGEGIDELRAILRGKTTAVAGPSGVGKSTIINAICQREVMPTGEISVKIERGKHTTRHSELFPVGGEPDTYIMDTPGFSSLQLPDIRKEELRNFYPEFIPMEDACRFKGCSHIYEPICGVKDALQKGQISSIRYENYRRLYEEIKDRDEKYIR